MSIKKAFVIYLLVLLSIHILAIGQQDQVNAASSITGNLEVISAGTDCTDTGWRVNASWLNTDDDTGTGKDRVALIVFDGNGVPIASNWSDSAIGNHIGVSFDFGNGDLINEITARPLTIQLHDVTFGPTIGGNFLAQYNEIIANNAPIAVEIIYDPADDIAGCASLPLIAAAPASSTQPQAQISTIAISAAQAQPVYESAGGNVVRDTNGQEIWLPQDFDGNGFDTHLVMSSIDLDGQVWYEIFIGDGLATVWIPADNVSVIE